mmetsp:Transcript_8368/g.25083  ORF Transcript_8368/g.25083 Transcript_8368/m.25083 type:complete len:215 (+) Transcript_8368:667-1311(+)
MAGRQQLPVPINALRRHASGSHPGGCVRGGCGAPAGALHGGGGAGSGGAVHGGRVRALRGGCVRGHRSCRPDHRRCCRSSSDAATAGAATTQGRVHDPRGSSGIRGTRHRGAPGHPLGSPGGAHAADAGGACPAAPRLAHHGLLRRPGRSHHACGGSSCAALGGGGTAGGHCAHACRCGDGQHGHVLHATSPPQTNWLGCCRLRAAGIQPGSMA